METAIAELEQRTAGPRYLELDGLRGLAAFTVIWHHFWLMFGLPEPWYVTPLIAGKQAVLLFFVLSGFVLSLPFWNRGSLGNYRAFIIRRFFRIYVPFAAAICLSALGAILWGQHNLPLGWFFHATWQVPVTASLLFHHLMMGPGHELNNALWSLRIEAQMSIAFPLLLIVTRLIGPPLMTAISFLLIAVGSHYAAKGSANPFLYLNIIQYSGMFLVGALLAQNRAVIHRVWDKVPPAWKALFFITSVLLYWGDADNICRQLHWPSPLNLAPLLGSVGLLICSIHVGWFRHMLRGWLANYLGWVSFSLYLLHEPVLYAITVLGFGKLPLILLALLYLVMAMTLSHVFCFVVEEPSLRVGKRFAAIHATKRPFASI